MACIQEKGIYYLTNVKGGSCIDLSGADNESIIGYGYHRGPNQVWIFERTGADKTFYIKSVGSAKFLSVAGEPRDGQKLVASASPYPWRVEDEPGVDSGVRLFSTGTSFCVDLSDHGNSKPGTPIELWGRWEGLNQVWELHKAE